MTNLDAVKARHSVRSYLSKPIPEDIRKQLQEEIDRCNQAGDLHIQLVTEAPETFSGFLARYGKFENVRNYIALIGPNTPDLDKKIGYFGERLALFAQTLGLNTCWVAMTFRKGASKAECEVSKREKLVCVLALGYGKTQGMSHKIKTLDEICSDTE